MATKFIDLDSVAPSVELTVKLGGKSHAMKPATVADFIANTKEIQKLGVNGDIEAETEIVIGMLLRAFPTMTKDMLLALTLEQLNQLNNAARAASGEEVVAEAAAQEAEANPPTAGS